MTKKEIRQTILGRYVELLVNNGYEFASLLGVSLTKLDYEKCLEKMLDFNENDYDWLKEDEYKEYTELVNKLK